jgi:hypothetical protein
VQVQALTTGDLAALQTQAVSALCDANGTAPVTAAPAPSSGSYVPQATVLSDEATHEAKQDVAVALAVGLAQRASALAQAISTFDVVDASRGVATPRLSLPVDANGASIRSATLAVGNLVDQMRSFEGQTASAGATHTGMGTTPPSALTAMQVAPIGMLDPLKQAATNDFASLSGIDFKR